MKPALQNLLRYLFYLLLVLLPWNVRYIFNFGQIQQLEGFREHLTWSVYAFDIIFFMLVVVWGLTVFLNRRSELAAEIPGRRFLLSFLLVLLASSFFSSQQAPAFYQTVRTIQSITFFLLATTLLKNNAIRIKAALLIFASGIFQAAIALVQFIIQRSIGLQQLGESLLAPDILGVAKIEVAGEKFIRAYGTFPHPNLLGAFLLISLAAGIWLTIQRKKPLSTSFDKFLVSRIFLSLGIFFILAGIFSTFSRSVWAVAGCLVILSIIRQKQDIPFFTFRHRRYLIIFAAVILLVFLTLSFPFISARFCVKNCANDKSFELRAIYNRAAIGFISHKPLLGVGPGNFIPSLNEYPVMWINNKETFPSHFLKPWEHQPAHNLYLLIASETGLIGLALLVGAIYSLSRPLPNEIFAWTFIGFLMLGMVDHYFWTLPQGQWLLWLGLAMASTADLKNITGTAGGDPVPNTLSGESA